MHVLAALLLALIPPVTPIPVELELCMLKAEICADDAAPDTGMCGVVDEDALQGCIAGYEDCSYGLPGASDPSCQIERTWCALEAPFWVADDSNADTVKYCLEVAETCPAY